MKVMSAILSLGVSLSAARAEIEIELPPERPPLEKHALGSEEVAVDQDELSADVQQLVIEQTHPKVIELLGEVENIMDEATEMLMEHDTGGKTIAAQTEIIEKIHAAAKQKQQQSGSESGGAMMDMMERMMGKQPGQGQKPGQGEGQQPGEGEQPGDQGGQGQTGESDSANTDQAGPGTDGDETRRVPKASGTAPGSIPEEFRSAFDAYNRGAETLVK